MLDSLCVDAEGNVIVATLVTAASPRSRRTAGEITHTPLPDVVVTRNACFAGPGLRSLYVTLSGLGKLVAIDNWPTQGCGSTSRHRSVVIPRDPGLSGSRTRWRMLAVLGRAQSLFSAPSPQPPAPDFNPESPAPGPGFIASLEQFQHGRRHRLGPFARHEVADAGNHPARDQRRRTPPARPADASLRRRRHAIFGAVQRDRRRQDFRAPRQLFFHRRVARLAGRIADAGGGTNESPRRRNQDCRTTRRFDRMSRR